MQQIATVTAKRQLTIPASLFRRLDLKASQKVLVKEEGGTLIVAPAATLVEDLAGSVPIPRRFQKMSAEEIVRLAKAEYFKRKKQP